MFKVTKSEVCPKLEIQSLSEIWCLMSKSVVSSLKSKSNIQGLKFEVWCSKSVRSPTSEVCPKFSKVRRMFEIWQWRLKSDVWSMSEVCLKYVWSTTYVCSKPGVQKLKSKINLSLKPKSGDCQKSKFRYLKPKSKAQNPKSDVGSLFEICPGSVQNLKSYVWSPKFKVRSHFKVWRIMDIKPRYQPIDLTGPTRPPFSIR